MPQTTIVTARRVRTMDGTHPAATAVAVAADGTIAAVGDIDDCRAAVGTGAAVVDLGDTVLAPGFVESHSHPLYSGVTTQPPAVWIAPYVGYPTFADVEALWRRMHAERPLDEVFVFCGLDRLLHGCDLPTADSLEQYFPGRGVVIEDNSGHGFYASHTYLRLNGWDVAPPPDPPAATFGRNPDGSLNGQAFEIPAGQQMVAYAMAHAGIDVTAATAAWYALMARNGITSATELSYVDTMQPVYEALASVPSVPVRVSLYHVATEGTCGDRFVSDADPALLHKAGIKLWADGSPWIGNIALSFPYRDSPATRAGGITRDTGGLAAMNYTRAELQAVVDAHAASGWQLAVHVNGDLAYDVVLDAFESGLRNAGRLGTDHRWRLEHLGAVQAHQFRRAAELGVYVSMSPFQFTYWGDLLDGELFPSEIGANWQRFRDAFDAGLHVCFHNDGSVSPPLPLRNIHAAVTRQTASGTVRGAAQRVSVDEAMRAETIFAAETIRRDDLVGSIAVGKLADFVELTADPYTVDPNCFEQSVQVRGTWLGGQRVDLATFAAAAAAAAAAAGGDHPAAASGFRRCC